MELLAADYAFLAITAIVAITGIFRGFSGSVAFVVASAAAIAAGVLGWPLTTEVSGEIWVRAIAVLVGALLVFGLTRMIVRKLVNGLLAQPADAIFGFLLGAAVCALVMVAWAMSGFYTEYSAIAVKAAEWLRG